MIKRQGCQRRSHHNSGNVPSASRPLWVVAALGSLCPSQTPVPCLGHPALEPGSGEPPAPQLTLGKLRPEYLSAYSTPTAIRETSCMEQKSVLGDLSFLPTVRAAEAHPAKRACPY